MFNSKKTSLFETSGKVSTNAFVNAGLKKAATTTSLGNGAVKYTTTGNDFVDQFGKVTNYKAPRSYQDVSSDMELLWSQNPDTCIRFALYIRMITRQAQLWNGEKTKAVQRGQGLKHEGIMRMLWIAINHPREFNLNVGLFIISGSWKDVIQMLSYDLQYHGWKDRKLNWNVLGQYIIAGLENPNTSNLIKKYLPQIKANSKCTTLEAQADNIISKWICSLLFGSKETAANYKKYRQLKVSGNAHQWQQLISQKKLLKIDFNTIHGRALALLVSSKFLKNHGLEAAYTKWIESKPVAKYTGYIYELLAPIKTGYHNASLTSYQESTINKQFMGVIETAKKGMKDESGLLVVVDSSSSMTSLVPGTKASSYSVAKAFALYFSYLLKGPFAGSFMEFANNAGLIQWKGNTPVDRIKNDRCEAYGGTNFQSVANVFIQLRQSGVPESDFPTGILAVSDGCFNIASINKSNFNVLMDRLRAAGFSKDYRDNFKVVLWDIPNNYYGKSQTAFEDFADTPNLYHISGLDPAAIAFLTGTESNPKIPRNSEELFEAAMQQEILDMVSLKV